MRRAAKVDANQGEIVQALRGLGFSVEPLHQVGGGVPDLLVGKHGCNFLLECKNGKAPPSQRKLTTDQIEWHASWRGRVDLIESIQDVIDFAREVENECFA